MSTRPRLRLVFLLSVAASTALASVDKPAGQDPDRRFQLALAAYQTGHLTQAAAELEQLVAAFPKSFEIHELLGLVYASESQDAKALPHLREAVRLNPDSAVARTNLGVNLSRTGQRESAGKEFQQAQKLAPKDYDPNHNLGEYYVQVGRIAEAIPFLEQAQHIQPAAYDNGYDLAMAYFVAGRYGSGRDVVQALLKTRDTDELHNLLGQIDEKDGKFVAAANEYEAAVHMDPSEDNLFDWGSELLLHRTYDPAIAVFQQATERYPQSPRLLIGLGMAMYSRGKYDDAVKALLKAADLNPSDPRCYLFLSKAYDSSPGHAEEVIETFRRYAELQPRNALAQYYYAMSLWKGKRTADSSLDPDKIKSLLQNAIALDDTLADAHIQLGNLLADQHAYDRSIPEYVRALQLSPNLADAHYRLGQDYVHTGQKELAQTEFALYQKYRAEHMAKIDKERAEVQQFVYAEKSAVSNKP